VITAPSSEESLAQQLREAGLTVDVVGDAYSPRGIEQSVFDGRRAAMHA
jgi:N,N-dimethylglycine/sarcosine dehydrogenase